jgi:YggT family protein
VEGIIMARVISYDRARADEIEEDRAIAHEEHAFNIVARVIWFVAGVIITLLAFRFVLALLGANPNNNFADFIYTMSHPFVEPFFSLFNYTAIDDGIGRFEIYTLIAIAVYTILAAGLARLATIGRH